MSLVTGSSAWGATGYGWRPAVQQPVRGLQVVIAGVDVSPYVDLRSFSFEQELDNRGQAEFDLVDVGPTGLSIELGSPVEIRINTALVFGGMVDTVDSQLAELDNLVVLRVQCVDWSSLLDKHVIVGRVVNPGSFREVVRKIVEELSGDPGETLADDGVVVPTDGRVAFGPTDIGPFSFNYQTVSEAFDDLAELFGYSWTLTAEKVIEFREASSNAAPFPIDETFREYRRLRVERTLSDYRNIQILRGGIDVTDVDLIETFAGDGEERSFTLSLPVAEKPTSVKVNAATKTTGIKQKEEAQFLYQVGDKVITQDDGETVLTSGDTLEVTYKGQFPVIVKSRDNPEITRFAAVSGTSGADTEVTQEDDIDTIELAERRASGLLRRFGKIVGEVKYETSRGGLRPGQLQPVTVPQVVLSGDLLITKIELKFTGFEDGEEVFEWFITASTGEFLGGWSRFFKEAAKGQRKFILRENEQLLVIASQSDIFTLGDAISVTDPLGAFGTDRYTFAIVGAYVGARRQKAVDDPTLDWTAGPLIGTPRYPDES